MFLITYRCVVAASVTTLVVGCSFDGDVRNDTDVGGGGTGTDTGGSNVGGGNVGGGGNTSVGGGGSVATCDRSEDCDDANSCTENVCGASGQCETTPVADGIAPGYDDIDGDCVENRCEGGVLLVDVVDDNEMPQSKNPCVILTCENGSVESTNQLVGFDCGGGLSCNATGQCVGCLSPAECPGTDNFCGTRTCDGNMTCGFNFTAAQTPLPAGQQTSGDCKELRCDGNGNTINVNKDTDVNSDGNVCTNDQCINGNPSSNPIPAGVACFPNGVCNAEMPPACVECVGQAQCRAPETCGGGGTPYVCG